MDVTSYLPQTVVTTIRHSEETISCLPVRKSDIDFYPIADECPAEDGLVSNICLIVFIHLDYSFGQDRIEITSENMPSWLADSPIVRKIIDYGGDWVTGGLSEILKLQPGDVVWIGKQRDRPEVKGFPSSTVSGLSVSRTYIGRIDGTWSAETPSVRVSSVVW